ncbi:concanavalin A-like lectin/glucanase domain-containing protein [Plectosphaerella plurivora]|uniref:Concanavalin A-like lectin/glucanase domain-containing protein n=1 Tax=Plectosphaerella plurivora TaxID=936078 RepID=A0A9P9AFY3_9PEZI|nr:concanavalin A-like lectin/glucanase domain-containing protein [Plectosphaerella plurivora]
MRGVAQRVLKSTSGPFGPYEARDVIDQMDAGILGAGHPHQGGLVDTPEGDWYYMAFTDVFPVGRAPILAPVTFDDEGWPTVVTNNAAWPSATKFPRQSAAPSHAAKTTIGKYSFDEPKLDHRFAWNHNPDNSKWRIESGHLVLQTGTVTNSLHAATNTLTLRTVGPGSIATVCLDVSGMRAGDRAGLCMLRDESAYIGIHAGADGRRTIAYVDDIKDGPKNGPDSVPVGFMNGRPVALDWKSYSVGTVGAETALRAEGSQVWLRVRADLRPRFVEPCVGEDRLAVFEYSVDGRVFTQLGPAHALTKSYHGFVGHRFGVFNFATEALGGEVLVSEVEVALWEPKGETVTG